MRTKANGTKWSKGNKNFLLGGGVREKGMICKELCCDPVSNVLISTQVF